MLKLSTTLLICLVMISLVGHHANAGDWAQFLGPDRNGVSTETDLINTWPAAGPKIVWRTPLGVSMSGVAVSQGAAFTMFQDETSQFVVCLNALTGKYAGEPPSVQSMRMRWATVREQLQQWPTALSLRSPVKASWSALKAEDGRKLWAVDVPKIAQG